MERTLAIECLKKIGQTVKLFGWVNRRRDHGQLVFIDLRDRSGVVQVVLQSRSVPPPRSQSPPRRRDSEASRGDTSEVARRDSSDGEGIGERKDALAIFKLRLEDVVEVEGQVINRSKEMINPKIPTGKIEVRAEKIKVLAKAKELPFDLHGDGYQIGEEIRLQYRYLDLRRPRLTKNIKLRSELLKHVRQYLYRHDFVEIETPILTKSTPEGARDFIVPSRLQPGKFYALPQSPQQYKQLLMVAGFERYFQIARCLRDEDLRADRGFEHTQIDMEMSFVKREDVMRMTEGLIIEVFEKMGAKILKKPFPIFTHKQALKKFGDDKFDLRSQKEKKDNVQAFAWVIDFPFFEKDKEGNWTFTHNPFSDPVPEHKEAFLKGRVEGILTTQYDLVSNGFEVGGGSIRSSDPKILTKVFEVLGYSQGEIKDKFGHMLEAFQYGAPPHGGIALGVARLLMCLLGENYLREIVAFPMTAGGRTAVMEAPSEIDPKQLKELGLAIKKTK